MSYRYQVSQACWSPSYDVRVWVDDDEAPHLEIGYYGLVKQNTGEDWNNCSLILSTATPSVGGSPPRTPSSIVKYS